MFRGRLARRVQQAGEEFTDFLEDLQQLAVKAYPHESHDIRDHLVLRGFFEGFHHSEVRFEVRKTNGDKEMNIANALERALHLEAVIRIEEEKQTPRIADIRRDETVILEDSANRLVQQTSIGNEKNARSSDGRRYNGHWGGTRINGNWYREQGSRDRARTPKSGTKLRKRIDNRRWENDSDKRRLCWQKAIGQRTYVIVLLVEVLPHQTNMPLK